MVTNSPSANFIMSIRLKRKMSKRHVALFAGLELEEYEAAESNPTKTPLFVLSQIFKALDMNSEEFTKFQLITHQELKDKRDKERKKLGTSINGEGQAQLVNFCEPGLDRAIASEPRFSVVKNSDNAHDFKKF